MIKKIKEKIIDADLVLVGFGEEFEEKYIDLNYDNIEKWKKEFLKSDYLNKSEHSDKIKAYNNVANLLEEKNYFVVTTCKDSYIYESQFRKDRIVAPCGNYKMLQCKDACSEELIDAGIYVKEIVDKIKNNLSVNAPICDKCKEMLMFNNIYADTYVEAGYKKQWEIYMKWLQGTINKKVCILEFGVGLAFPTVIRWPFEKVAYFNNKADFYRIHTNLYQLPQEMNGKGNSLAQNSLEFCMKLE